MKRVISVVVVMAMSATLLIGCAKPPIDDLNRVLNKVQGLAPGNMKTGGEKQIAQIRELLKREEGKLFKNFDPVKEKIATLNKMLREGVAPSESESAQANSERFHFTSAGRVPETGKPVTLITDTLKGTEILSVDGAGVLILPQ